jgi:protein SCO1/2
MILQRIGWFMHFCAMLLAVFFLFLTILAGCSDSFEQLPMLGNPVVVNSDTIYPVIPPFSLIDQDGKKVTETYFKGKIYVADFIFLSCPTICPKMTTEMKMVYETYKANTDVLLLSHTIDPKRDTPERLREYVDAMGIDSKKWVFATGNRDSIYAIAEKSYYATAYADSTAPGGFVHSGGLLMIDKERHIRGVYDGTDPKETKRLCKDIEALLGE